MLYYRPTFQSYRSTRMMATHTEKGNYGNDTGNPDVKFEIYMQEHRNKKILF